GPGQNVWSSTFGSVSATGLSTTGSPGARRQAAGDRDAGTPAASSYDASTPPSSGSGGFNADTTAGEWLECPSECMQFAINKVSNAKRGKSDLATLLPWLRRYKDWLTDRVRINKYKGAFLWTIKLTGADRKTIDRKHGEVVKAGTLPAGADRHYGINVPELVPDDNTTLATAASTMANTLALARDRGWISDETAMKLLFGFANVPVDVEEERARIA